MNDIRCHLLLLGAVFLLCACSRKLYPDRSQFIKDGDTVPVLNLSTYKSVQERPGQDPNLALVVAISGGGSRAANFASGVLAELERLYLPSGRNLLQEVDYFSTVSGGGFAAGAYVAALYDHQRFFPDSTFSYLHYWEYYIQSDLQHSYTWQLARANVNPRLLFSYMDDGDILERAIDNNVLGYRRRNKLAGMRDERPPRYSLTLGDFFLPKDSPQPVRFPMPIANTTVLGKWVLFPFTPDMLQTYQVIGYTHRLHNHIDPNLDPYSVPLAVGIKASGSFPVLIANTTLKSAYSEQRPWLHLLDGGLSDNVGFLTALEILKQDPAPRKVLLLIDVDNVGNRPVFSHRRGAMFGLKVLAQLPSSGLDARRVRLLQEIAETCSAYDIQHVMLSFGRFLQNSAQNELPIELQRKEEYRRLLPPLENNALLTPRDQQILYELLTAVGTKYHVTKEEQRLLFHGGRQLVRLLHPEILEAVLGAPRLQNDRLRQ